MITSGAYYELLSFQNKLNQVISGNTAGLDPALVALGVAWATAMFNKAQAQINVFITAVPIGP